MKKNDKLHIPISTEEKKKLITRAEACELTLASYCRFILLKAVPVVENI
jgi:hypothetical protein